MNSLGCASSKALALFIIHCLGYLRRSLPLESCIYIIRIKGRSDEMWFVSNFRNNKSKIKSDLKMRCCKFLILLGLVYSPSWLATHALLNTQLKEAAFPDGCGAWELDASLCVFVNPWEMALGWVQAVCLCAYCSLSAWGGPALSPY